MQELISRLTEFWEARSWIYILQFVLFAVLFYMVFKVLKSNKGGKFIALFVFIELLCGVAFAWPDNINSEILLIVIFIMAMIVFNMYHTEIKRSLLDSIIHKKTSNEELTVTGIERVMNEMVKALQNMSKNDVGALIVLSDGNLPEGIIESGTVLKADISAQMIEAVFYPKAPLHDGAMVIEDNKIYAAGCFLPLNQSEALPKEMGSRHRAALGVTMVASVTAIVVSEETGIISIMKNGEVIKRYAAAADIKNALSDFYWSDLTAEGKR
ncbi:MAG: hypothetical protein E7370_02745 [Clostridiales bacterium]|nr:hypothetical protein [Clostridiales bacterium]